MNDGNPNVSMNEFQNIISDANLYFSEHLVDPSWKYKIISLVKDFSNSIQGKYISWNEFKSFFSIEMISEGLISDSFFLNDHKIDSGIANCTISRILINPSIVIVRTSFPDPDFGDNDMLNEIMNTILQLKVQIILSIDQFPPKLLGKCIINEIAVIHNIKQTTVDYFSKFTNIPIIDSFISLYSSINLTYKGIFYVASGGFEPNIDSPEIIPDQLYKLIKSGKLIPEGQSVAHFISTDSIPYGTFILAGCQDNKVKISLFDLIYFVFDQYCFNSISKYIGFSPKNEDKFKNTFSYSLIHFTSPNYSVCTTKRTDIYSDTDLSLNRFFEKSAKHASKELNLFKDKNIGNSLFSMQKGIQFRILHQDMSLTFSSYEGIVTENSSLNLILINNEIKTISEPQFFEVSFSSFVRYLFHAKYVPDFIIIHNCNALHICRSPSKVVFEISKALPPPRFVDLREFDLNRDSDPNILKNIRIYANIVHATEVIYAQSLSKCPPESSAPLFSYLNTFLKSFAQKVIANTELPCVLNSTFFTTFFNWYMKMDNISEKLRNVKLPDSVSLFATTICRTIILRLLWFIDFPHLGEVLSELKDYSDNESKGVPALWLFDKNDGRKPKSPTNSEYLYSFVTLLHYAENSYFFPEIVMLHNVNLNHTKITSILAFVFACDKFHVHLLNNCPTNYSEFLFNAQMTTTLFSEYLTVFPQLSPKFSIELEEKTPLPWSLTRPTKVQIDLHFPSEFAALMSLFGYSFDTFCEILRKGKSSITFGGKSHAQFFVTDDGRFLIKTINQSEMSEMNNFLPHYFRYITANPSSLLTRIFSVFTIIVDGNTTYKGILMENLRHGFTSDDVILYDFKGAMRNRFLNENNQSVMLDTNYEKSALDNRIILTLSKKKIVLKQLLQDSHFLASHNIMDYSLVVVLSKTTMKIRLGIVDYFRKYTIDKALETWVKKTPIYEEYKIDPTIISPDNYCERFVNAMEKYFYQSPNEEDIENLDTSSIEDENI